MLFHRSLRREFSTWNDDAKQNSAAGWFHFTDKPTQSLLQHEYQCRNQTLYPGGAQLTDP